MSNDYVSSRVVSGVQMAWIDTDRNGWTTPVQKRYCWTPWMNTCLFLPFLRLKYINVYYNLCGQSKDATCEDYGRGDSSSVTPEVEDVTFLTPLQKDCKTDGEDELTFCISAIYCTVFWTFTCIGPLHCIYKCPLKGIYKSTILRFVHQQEWHKPTPRP